MAETISGTLQQCWQHFFQHSAVQVSLELRQKIAQFLHIEPARFQVICRNGLPQRGVTLMRLQYFLADLGYEVQELQALRTVEPLFWTLGYMIAHEQATYEEVVTLFDECEGTALLQRLRGKRSFSGRSQRQRVVDFIATRNPVVDEKKADSSESLALKFATAIKLIGELQPLLMFLLENCTAEERKTFRQLCGEQTYFEFVVDANRVCGDRINQHLQRRREQ